MSGFLVENFQSCCFRKNRVPLNFSLVVVVGGFLLVGYLGYTTSLNQKKEKKKKEKTIESENTKSFVTKIEAIIFVGLEIAPMKLGTAETVLQ